MKKNINKLATLALTGILMTGMSFGSLAANAGINSGVENNTITFKKELGVLNVTEGVGISVSVPHIGYTYNVAPGSDGETANGYAVQAGKGSKENAASTSFSDADQSDANDDNVVTHSNVSLDLSFIFDQGNVTEPGIYRYVVTEVPSLNSTDQGYDYAGDTTDPESSETYNKRYLDVYVGRENGTLKVLSTVMFKTTTDEKVDAEGKTDGYEVPKTEEGKLDPTSTEGSIYKTYDLTLKKQIFGNMIPANQEFEFTIDFTAAPNGVIFETSDSEKSLSAVASNVSSTSGFKLKGGDTLTIKSVPVDVLYKFTENIEDKDGYTVTNGTNVDEIQRLTNDSAYEVSGKVSTETQMSSETGKNKVYFLNIKNDLPVTGVVMNIAPYAAMILGAGAFAGVFLGRKKSEDEE